MKTKDLIFLLERADPSGELHACVSNWDIADVARIPAYYDGALQVIERADPLGLTDLTPIRARMVGSGEKVVITAPSIQDELFDNPELPVEVEGYLPSPGLTIRLENIERWRDEGRKSEAECAEIWARVEREKEIR